MGGSILNARSLKVLLKDNFSKSLIQIFDYFFLLATQSPLDVKKDIIDLLNSNDHYVLESIIFRVSSFNASSILAIVSGDASI